MQITRQAEYAVRTVLYLAKQAPDASIPTARIAQEQEIPSPFLAKIVLQLSALGILRTSRGARGGVQLAKPASEISLLQIVEAIDGPIEINNCVLEAGRCHRSRDCAVRAIWCDAYAKLAERLAQTNFAQLASNGFKPQASEG